MNNIINADLLKRISQSCSNQMQWKPVVGGSYFFAEFSHEDNEFTPTEEILGVEDSDTFDFPIFRTVDECQTFCGKLNKEISHILP